MGWVYFIPLSKAKPQRTQRSNHPLHAQIHVVEIFKILPSSISYEISHRFFRMASLLPSQVETQSPPRCAYKRYRFPFT